MTNTLLVINPTSGKTEIKSFLFPLFSSLSSSLRRVEVLLLERDVRIEDYIEGKDEIICCGGDGTLNSAINAILKSGKEKSVRLGYIPCGSTNDFARSAGIPLDISAAIQNIATGKERKIDVGIWNRERAFTYVASFGAFSNVSYSTSQDLKNSLGHFAYILNGLTDLGNIKAIPLTIKTENETISDEYCFGAVLNSTSMAGIVKLDKCQVDMSDGLFEVLLVKKPKTLIDLNSIITAISTSSFSSPLISFFKCKNCIFEFQQEMDWSLDGEKGEGGKRVEIRNEKRKITIIVPEEK